MIEDQDPKKAGYSSDDSYFDDSDSFSSDNEEVFPQLQPAAQAEVPTTDGQARESPMHTSTSAPTEGLDDMALDSETIDPIQIVNDLLPEGYTVLHPPPSIAEVSSVSADPDIVTHLNEIQGMSITEVHPIIKDSPEHGLLLNSARLAIYIEKERDRIFGIVLQVYGALFPELADVVLDKGDYVAAAGICSTHFLSDPATDADFDAHAAVLTRLSEMLPSQQVAVVVALASVTKGLDGRSAEALADTNDFLVSAAAEMKLLEEIKQIFLDHLMQRIHLFLPNMCQVVGSGIAAQLFGIVNGRVERLTTMTREDVMLLGVPYQDARHSLEDFAGMPVGYVGNCDLVRYSKNKLGLDAYTVHKVVKAVASKVVLAARIDTSNFAPDGEKGYTMKKHVIRRINRLEKEIADKEVRRTQNYLNRQKLMDEMRAHREDMRLNRQLYGKDSTADTERAFELWKDIRMQEAAQANATLYSQNKGRMTMKQHGRHQQLLEATSAARAAGMSLAEYEQHKRQSGADEAQAKKGFRRPQGGIWRKRKPE